MPNLPEMPLTLTKMESESVLWIKLREHIAARLDALRRQNDQSMTPDETERLRGRIAAYKELMGLETGPLLDH